VRERTDKVDIAEAQANLRGGGAVAAIDVCATPLM